MKLITLLILVMLIVVPGGCKTKAPDKVASVDTPASYEAKVLTADSNSDIRISFKKVNRIAGCFDVGERWVSPATLDVTQKGETLTVEAKAYGLSHNRQFTQISPEWISQYPEMTSVSPKQGHNVKITVRGAGQSKLRVISQGIAKDLLIQATYKNNALQVEITQ